MNRWQFSLKRLFVAITWLSVGGFVWMIAKDNGVGALLFGTSLAPVWIGAAIGSLLGRTFAGLLWGTAAGLVILASSLLPRF